MQREALPLESIPWCETGPVECPHCDQLHGDELWHWQWCFRCRAHVRTCVNVAPRRMPNRAPCVRHQPRMKPVQVELFAAVGGAS